jgi:hypothetical protein
MKRLFSLFLGAMIGSGMLSLPAVAQEYSNGTGAINKRGRDEATKTPVEAFGVHPPGPDPAYNRKIFFRRWRFTFIPYYAPASPTASSVRWKPWCYFPLMPYYTPYYIGYCPKRLHNPPPACYGSDGGWGQGPMPDHPMPPNPQDTPLRYGVYTSVLQDDTIFWNMGGNGLVPYGTPRPPHEGPPDLVDMIQTTRAGGPGGSCAPVVATEGPAIAPPGEPAAPDVLPPPKTADQTEDAGAKKGKKDMKE